MMDLERSETFSDFKQIGPNHNFTPNVHSSVLGRTFSLRPGGGNTGASGAPANGDTENELYRTMNDDGDVLDEETINWPVLIARVFAFFLLFLVILFCSLEEVSHKFLWLAAIVCVVLLVVIVCTYVDLRPYICCCCPNFVNANYFITRRVAGKGAEEQTISSVTAASATDAYYLQYSGSQRNPLQTDNTPGGTRTTSISSVQSTGSFR
jgi:hypothetical protein